MRDDDVVLSDRLTVAEAMAYLRLSKRTLARMRRHGIGPVFIQDGKRVFYRKADLDEYTVSKAVITQL